MPRPVRRIALPEGSLRRRAAGAAAALLIAGLALFVGFRALTRVDAGWQEIEPDASRGPTGDVALWAELGAGSESPLTERRFLTGVYSEAAREITALLSPYEVVSGVRNLWWINHHPNEEIPVDPRLYRALSQAAAAGRELYLGPVYELWDSVFFSRTDAEARAADPRLNPESGAALAEFMALLSREDQISLLFPAENTVCLRLSPELAALGEEYGVTRYLDFGWMTNAYAADALAEALLASGWTRAALVSPDGFIRCLDGRGTFSLEVLSTRNGRVVKAAETEYAGPAAVLQLIPTPRGSRARSYLYADGTLRTAWISAADGLDRCPVDSLNAVSSSLGCAELLSRVLPMLTAERFSADRLEAEPLLPEGEAEYSLLVILDDRLIRIGDGFIR